MSRASGFLALFAAALLVVGCSDDSGTPPKPDSGTDIVISPDGVTGGSAALTLTNMCGTGGLEAATVSYTGGTDVTTDANGLATIEGLAAGEYTFTVTKKGYLPKTVTVTVEDGKEATGAADVECQSLVVAEAARAWLDSTSATGAYPVITTAKSIFDNYYDGDATNDPVVISVRATTDYEVAHVPTAINIPWKTVADDASLALLGTPGAKKFVDYCYTGHTGGIAGAVLSLLGYPTANMKYGFASWTSDAAKRGAGAVNPDNLTNDFTIETTDNPATGDFTVPWLEYDNVTTADEAVKAAAKGYLSNAEMKPTYAAKTLFDNLNDGDATNDPFIISVRSAAHYALGHIPGAINIPWKEIAKPENLKKIPTDREIVIYCYTGHTGAIATAMLGVLGYHKVKNLKYGFHGWTLDATARAIAPFDATTDVNDFATVSGSTPGTFPTTP